MEKRTVYIVGAGASYEAGLPTGKELKMEIARILNMKNDYGETISGDGDIRKAIQFHAVRIDSSHSLYQKYLSECLHISVNMPLAISIDNFIDSQKGNEILALCGKLAIIKSILTAEKRSKVNFFNPNQPRKINFSVLEGTWYLSFFKTLTEQLSIHDLKERFKKVTLIIFNYDRCLEHFLYFALMSYYRISDKEAAEIIENLTIIHPYGVVGYLDWQNKNNGSVNIDFGGELHYMQLIKYASEIRTFTEGAHSDYMPQLKQNMQNAERLIFLGFAFHHLNMELIGSEEGDGGYENQVNIDCYATTYEMSKSDQDLVKKSILHLYKDTQKVKIYIENTTCNRLFLDYSRSLGYS